MFWQVQKNTQKEWPFKLHVFIELMRVFCAISTAEWNDFALNQQMMNCVGSTVCFHVQLKDGVSNTEKRIIFSSKFISPWSEWEGKKVQFLLCANKIDLKTLNALTSFCCFFFICFLEVQIRWVRVSLPNEIELSLSLSPCRQW